MDRGGHQRSFPGRRRKVASNFRETESHVKDATNREDEQRGHYAEEEVFQFVAPFRAAGSDVSLVSGTDSSRLRALPGKKLGSNHQQHCVVNLVVQSPRPLNRRR